jgi:hypothetical protein
LAQKIYAALALQITDVVSTMHGVIKKAVLKEEYNAGQHLSERCKLNQRFKKG